MGYCLQPSALSFWWLLLERWEYPIHFWIGCWKPLVFMIFSSRHPLISVYLNIWCQVLRKFGRRFPGGWDIPRSCCRVEEMAWPSDFNPSPHLSEPLKTLRTALQCAIGGSRTPGSSEERGCCVSHVEGCRVCVLLLTPLQPPNFLRDDFLVWPHGLGSRRIRMANVVL